MTLAILIPDFNEEKTITRVIKKKTQKIAGINKKIVFLIDDGSVDRTAEFAKKAGAQVLVLPINQGVGTATITGIEAAKIIGADLAVTLDADGQHDPGEISKIVSLITRKKYDVVLGARLLDRHQMPIYKIIGNSIMNWITYVLVGLWVKDSQSGFKGFSKKAFSQFKLTSSGYEICSEIIGEIKRLNLKYIELPVKTIYSDHSKKRGQFSLNAVNIILRLIIKKITG